MKKSLFFFGLVVSAIVWYSCSYENEEKLFGKDNDCDTVNVSYAVHIAPAMAMSCNSCHSSIFPQGGVNTSDYSGLSVVAADGRLKGSVNHEPGYSPMPPGQPKLDSCLLKRITAWINQGYPEN